MTITWVPGQVADVVDAPPRVPYDGGLFSVLDFPTADRGSVPIVWESQGCILPEAVRDVCLHGAAPHVKQSTIECGEQFSTGFSVYTMDQSSLGRNGIDTEAAERQLEFAEQVIVEAHLLILLDENNVAAPAIGASTSPVSTLGIIEQALAGRGARGVIIMSRYLATHLAAAGALDASGDGIRTKLGTPVAALGAPFDAPADPLAVFGVTGLTGVRGPVTTASAVNKSTNDLSAVAERDYSIGFECEAFRALATIA